MTHRATDHRHRRHAAWTAGADHTARLAVDQVQAAGELVRVSRRNGRIGLASSASESLVGRVPFGIARPALRPSLEAVMAFG